MPAYDTVVVNSPPIDQDTRDILLGFCSKVECVDMCTNEVQYCFTSAKLEGSFDYRIRMNIENREWVKYEGQLTPSTIECEPYLRLECSVHKLMNTHNCFGGPTDIKKSIAYLVGFIEECTGVKLPPYHLWEVDRIDIAKLFEFKSESICKRIIEQLILNVYSRRRHRPYDNGVCWPSTTTTPKFYWKGPEFKNHDYKRLIKYCNREIDKSVGKDYGDLNIQKLKWSKKHFDKVLEKAMKIIRFEVEIKKRKLKELFNSENVYVWMLEDEILIRCMEDELFKCVKEREDMDIVRRSDLVEERLNEVHGIQLGNKLYGVWAKMVEFGEKHVRETMSRSTFFRYKSQLQEAGVSWSCGNVNLRQLSIVPDDFTFLNDKYVNNEVSEIVYNKLKAIA